MSPSSFRPFRVAVGSLLLCVGGLLVGGCDGAGSKRASLYERLVGTTWTIERLEGSPIDPNQLDERYPKGVRLTFQEDEGERTYRLTGHFSGDSTDVLATGTVILPSDDVLWFKSGFGRTVTWRYRFEASRAIFDLQSGYRTFLSTLFPERTWGESQPLTMTLAPDDG